MKTCKRLRFKISLLICLGMVLVRFDVTPMVLGASSDFTIAEGSRFEHPEKGFSLVPPAGWEIHQNYSNLSLLLQVPFSKGLKYQRTIQVMSFQGPKYIDDITRREFETIIVDRYSQITQSIQNFRIRNHMVTQMEDGREGILYYAEFDFDDKAMMQAHILLSSAKRSYLLTYTDVIEHFEGEGSSEYLTEAWECMTSILLESEAPVRFHKTLVMGFLGVFVLILVFVFFLFRYFRARRKYGPNLDLDEPSSSIEGHSLHSQSAGSEIDTAMSAMGTSSGIEDLEELDDDEGDNWSLTSSKKKLKVKKKGSTESGLNNTSDDLQWSFAGEKEGTDDPRIASAEKTPAKSPVPPAPPFKVAQSSPPLTPPPPVVPTQKTVDEPSAAADSDPGSDFSGSRYDGQSTSPQTLDSEASAAYSNLGDDLDDDDLDDEDDLDGVWK